MKYYDETGRRVPAPRHDKVPSNASTALLSLFFVAVIIGLGVWALMSQGHVILASESAMKAEKSEHLITHDSMTAVHTYDGEIIRFYVMTDPDTQVQYIVNDRGGMCVRESPYE